MMQRRTGSGMALGWLCVALASAATVAAPKEKPPERVRDLAYGAVLYEYHQGNAFAALTELAIAEQKGGIQGHGDHPALLRGGMMLSYGMTRAAKDVFAVLLKENLNPATRNLAWFYLAKVFHLERDFVAAADAITHIEMQQLNAVNPGLHEEALYLKGQIALAERNEAAFSGVMESLPANSVWRPYLEYNHAVLPATAGVLSETLARMRGLAISDEIPLPDNERLALRDRLYLTEASFQLDAGESRAAMSTFQKVRLDGPLSDQALFGFALATANEKEFGLSLQALLSLSGRPLFNPWVQQVPYALGYLYEQLDNKEQALEAYSTAASQYLQLRGDLDGMIDSIGEAAILQALEVPVSGSQGQSVVLGDKSIPVDSFGRLKVRPANFNLAQRIASEPFQIGLRDLHELYKLRDLFKDWESRLAATDLMLETRERQFSEKSAQVMPLLQQEDAAVWQQQVEEYSRQVDAAVSTEDVTSWAADSFAVNNEQVQKELRQLTDAVTIYQDRRIRIAELVASSDQNSELKNRIVMVKSRVETLSLSLQEHIAGVQAALIELVRKDLLRQRREVVGYLVASQEAKARLIDEKFRAQQQEEGGS
jgi:tetratricopeptide (TPR) repeat protein